MWWWWWWWWWCQCPVLHVNTVFLITLLPAGKTQLMEHDTPWGKATFVRQAVQYNRIQDNNRTTLNAKFMNECSPILTVSTNAIQVCILSSILLCNLTKYLYIASLRLAHNYICLPHSWLTSSPRCVYLAYSTIVPIGRSLRHGLAI